MRECLLSEPKDVLSLQNNIEILINNEKLRIQLGLNALKSVQKYDWDLVSNDVLDYYRQLILKKENFN